MVQVLGSRHLLGTTGTSTAARSDTLRSSRNQWDNLAALANLVLDLLGTTGK
jgi:hypothetical protein